MIDQFLIFHLMFVYNWSAICLPIPQGFKVLVFLAQFCKYLHYIIWSLRVWLSQHASRTCGPTCDFSHRLVVAQRCIWTKTKCKQ